MTTADDDRKREPPPRLEDIELAPDAWERFTRTVRRMAETPPSPARIASGGSRRANRPGAGCRSASSRPPSMDRLQPERRSALMARVRSKDTTPEMRVRRLAHRLGYRYRLHRRDLPGVPDLIFPRLRLAVFVHGCFWQA